MKDTFSSAELTALRNDLIHDVLIDSREAAELLQLFLMGRGFGASPEAVQTPWAVSRGQAARSPCCKASCRTSHWSCERPPIEIKGSAGDLRT